MHIILHDTAHKRAVQTNAEDLILNLILHRRGVGDPANDETRSDSTSPEVLEFADPDRRSRLTRQVMLSNSEKIVSLRKQLCSIEPVARRFKNEVEALYSTIDGLCAHNHAGGGGTEILKMSFNFKKNVHGSNTWTFLKTQDGWSRSRPTSNERPGIGMTTPETLGNCPFWGQLWGSIAPCEYEGLCSGFTSIPRNECYLAVRVDSAKSVSSPGMFQGPKEAHRLRANAPRAREPLQGMYHTRASCPRPTMPLQPSGQVRWPVCTSAGLFPHLS